ncbi:MAG TPA: HTH domain-containing protein [Vicinamibacterales bacterium]|nr:HTH domain-containing protein [Vicinamibacterales bacterium]
MSGSDDRKLPPGLRAFIHSCIESIEQVELLLLLRGSQGTRTAREISEDLHVSIALARRDVETLAARGLLEVSVGTEIAYRYRPKTEELAKYCDLLAQYYITQRQNVLGFVATESRLSIKRFADAFKLGDQEKS